MVSAYSKEENIAIIITTYEPEINMMTKYELFVHFSII